MPVDQRLKTGARKLKVSGSIHKGIGHKSSHTAKLKQKLTLLNPVEEDVPDFPRGGGASYNKENCDDDSREILDSELESGYRLLEKRKKGKKVQGRTLSTKDDLGSLFGDRIMGKFPRFCNRINVKNVAPGMKLWGVIIEVNEKDIVVSLPGGLRGLVRALETFDPILKGELKQDAEEKFLSTLVVGQLVSCIVLRVDDDKKEIANRKIWLSLHLSLLHKGLTLDVIQEGMMLTAYVKSIEDHGFILHFGLPSFSGFMPKYNKSGTGSNEVSMCQLVQGVVKSVDKARKVVHMSSDLDIVSKCVIKDLKGISIDLLIPGMMVNACVQSTLENGIMLSFLTYFTGTVDVFNLEKTFPSPNWKNDYAKNMKFNARISFIDPSTRAVGLTMNPYLVSNKAPPSIVKSGDIFDQARVTRVDKGSGLLLEIPTLPIPTPTFVSITDVADMEAKKLGKNFKEGNLVRVRVLGFKHLEGIATGTLKTSAIEGSVFTHSDVKPGMIVKARVLSVESYGAIVQFPSGVKALCPLRHMSEFETVKPRKKFQVGVELVFRVLGCKFKRISVTHKKTLVKSKLEIICSYADATDGLVTHGWITKIENHGCYVHFYNGVQGFASRSELGLGPESDISSMYHVEQVVKCRVVKSIPSSRRLILSFNMTSREPGVESVKPGSIVSGVVEQVLNHTVIVDIHASNHMKGMVSLEHLADHHCHAASMMSLLKPGYHFDQLLVLDIEGNNYVLTAKYSLINAIQQLPVDVADIHCNSVVHGYVCNIIESGCFVRYIGRLTGFAPKGKATDYNRADLSEAFFVGQSVRSNILQINSETGRITVSLKQSLCYSTDSSFIQEYFLLDEKIAKMQQLNSMDTGMAWFDDFSIGRVVEGEVQETKEFGVVISFEKHRDVLGFISHHQLADINLENNRVIRAVVIDISKIERLVDLTLKPNFINRSNEEFSMKNLKKRKREAYEKLELNQSVNALVEIVKENYLVLSIPAYDFCIGYASLTDYNNQKMPHKQFTNGQSVTATVVAFPNPSTCGRLLLLLKSCSGDMVTSISTRVKNKPTYEVGSLVQVEITEIKPLELKLKFGAGHHGRIHVTEITDDYSSEWPLSTYEVGQTLSASIVSKGFKPERNKGNCLWELSVKPSILRESCKINDLCLAKEFNFSYGQQVSGFVHKIDDEWVWVAISRYVKAQLYILDSSCEPSELEKFSKSFCVGKSLSGFIISMNKEKKLLRLVLHQPDVGHVEQKHNDPDCRLRLHISEGTVVGGRISKILPGVGGLLVQVDKHICGKVHYTELTNSRVPNPLYGYHEGKFVKCKVLEINRAANGTVRIDLSLRSESNDTHYLDPAELNGVENYSTRNVDNINDIHTDMVVQGYVKNISPKGCFLMLSRKIDAKVLLSNLSENFIDNPEIDFPVGKLVIGKVLSVEPLSKRVELTLKTSSDSKELMSNTNWFSSCNIGDIVSGNIKRVESYGLFISIDKTNVVGLCHISELSDDRMDDLLTEFKVGTRVTAKILNMESEKNRVSLGMKKSYFKDVEVLRLNLGQSPASCVEKIDTIVETEPKTSPKGSAEWIENNNFEIDQLNHHIVSDFAHRSLVPPLEVSLDDIEMPDYEVGVAPTVSSASDAETIVEKNKRAKKKSRNETEREILAAEDRFQENDIPRSADEFEKLVRSSPNSSFLWIKYMAFMLSLADIEKARSIAERALKTINFREESEKLNIWVAYLNLENEHGDPPEEAVVKIFQRALQHCDPKKVHLALLGMYERTDQAELADELLNKMAKKFKHSCKVWFSRFQFNLKRKSDGIQSVVNRALLSLPQHKHIKYISQTAILEFKCGVPDRGRSMFEGMLREYPKRTDLWSIYLDQEILLGDVSVIRALFERAISLSLPPKKMKFLFKKYLEYEKSIGDEERIESVKKKALDYVESVLT